MYYRFEPDLRPQVFRAGFSGGEPASYAPCLIHGPESGLEGGPEFQSGRTDARGIFAFVPDRDGVWNVVVDGGMGHRLAFDVLVNSTAPGVQAVPKDTPSGGYSRTEILVRAGLGASLILNLFLVPTLLRRRRIH